MVKKLGKYHLEYYDDTHTYLVDGIIVPSITEMLKVKFGDKYNHVNNAVLQRAAARGTAVHEAIERYCRYNEPSDLKEVRNFRFLQKQYGFKVIDNEVPVILEYDGEPVSAGRLDMVLTMNGEMGGADIKCTSVLDKNYLAYQLNLYRIAFYQTYGLDWTFLRGIHLKDDKRKFVEIPVNDWLAWEIVKEHFSEHK